MINRLTFYIPTLIKLHRSREELQLSAGEVVPFVKAAANTLGAHCSLVSLLQIKQV